MTRLHPIWSLHDAELSHISILVVSPPHDITSPHQVDYYIMLSTSHVGTLITPCLRDFPCLRLFHCCITRSGPTTGYSSSLILTISPFDCCIVLSRPSSLSSAYSLFSLVLVTQYNYQSFHNSSPARPSFPVVLVRWCWFLRLMFSTSKVKGCSFVCGFVDCYDNLRVLQQWAHHHQHCNNSDDSAEQGAVDRPLST